MFGWCGDASWSVWSWWWVVPLIGMVLCMTLCLFFRSSSAGRRFSCWGGVSDDRLDEMRKEIKELKEEIAKMKKT